MEHQEQFPYFEKLKQFVNDD